MAIISLQIKLQKNLQVAPDVAFSYPNRTEQIQTFIQFPQNITKLT